MSAKNTDESEQIGVVDNIDRKNSKDESEQIVVCDSRENNTDNFMKESDIENTNDDADLLGLFNSTENNKDNFMKKNDIEVSSDVCSVDSFCGSKRKHIQLVPNCKSSIDTEIIRNIRGKFPIVEGLQSPNFDIDSSHLDHGKVLRNPTLLQDDTDPFIEAGFTLEEIEDYCSIPKTFCRYCYLRPKRVCQMCMSEEDIRYFSVDESYDRIDIESYEDLCWLDYCMKVKERRGRRSS